MTNSSRTPQPGDSSVDFSHLEDAEENPPWLPPPSDSAVEFETDGEVDEDVGSASTPNQGDKQDFGKSLSHASSSADRPASDLEREGSHHTPPVESDSPAPADQIDDTVVGLPAFDPPERANPDQTAGHASAGGPFLSGGEPKTHAQGTPPNQPDSTASSPSTKTDGRGATVSHSRQRLLLILIASYASAVTLALVWLLLNRSAAQHELEHLPDVAPLSPNEFRYVPENASMPPGHTLPIGQERQLGYILVEPLEVSKGPVEFTHYADGSQTKPATEPVLKLWLRFTNVSADQLIAPLDREMLFKRKFDNVGEPEIANQLVSPAERSKSDGVRAFVLDHPESSEWDLKGQRLGYRLKPGESIETYIPTDPGDDSKLTGDLHWRVHLRKGYHATTGHGVTTVIEVPFHSDDVRIESAAT